MGLFVKKNPFKRLYQISLRSAVIISLPFFILVGWMITDALSEYNRFVRMSAGVGSSPSINTSIVHLYLRNALQRSFARISSPSMPEDDELPLFQMTIDPESLAALSSNLPASGKSQYYKAFVQYGGKSYTVKARYMGDNYWNWFYPQKSLRIKTSKKKLIEDRRKINIKNPRTILTINEAVAQELAREIGLIAPRVFPVKFVQNNVYMGVYLFWEKIDESTIRSFKKMPGSVYEGDGAPPDPESGVSLLWADEKFWTKSASRNAEQENFRQDIKILIDGVNTPDLEDFYAFVNKYINKKTYSTFLSLDNVTTSMHHDYHHNHKFYFDPLIGKFEPISWDIDVWHLIINNFDAVGNPLLNKWKLIPEFDLMRQQRLFELINGGELSLDNIFNKIASYYTKIKPALTADVFRDARDAKRHKPYFVLKFPVHPCGYFSVREFDREIRVFKEILQERFVVLNDYLNKSTLEFNLTDFQNGQLLRFASSGNVGRKVTGLKISGSTSSVSLYRDSNRNEMLDENDLLIGEAELTHEKGYLALNEKLLPGYRKISDLSSPYFLGDYRLEVTSLTYDYFIKTKNGRIDSIEVESENIVTGKPEETNSSLLTIEAGTDAISLHPWKIPADPKAVEKSLGPGIVTVKENMIFPEHINLKILPGTTIRISEGVSIFCSGKVEAKGSKDLPIRFEAMDPEKPWGSFVLQGNGASSSEFSWCSWRDGSVATRDLVNYSGMVSAHDVDNLKITNCRFGRNHIGDDGLHLAYCDNFFVEDSLFYDARSDALDIDISKGKVIFCRFVQSGNDSLDFMTSDAEVTSCYFERSGDKGISVGEKSGVVVNNSVFKNCSIGLEVKDQSEVKFNDNMIEKSPLAINLYKKNWRYNGGGNLVADTLYIVGCDELLKKDKKSRVDYSNILMTNPHLPAWDDTMKRAGESVPGKRLL